MVRALAMMSGGLDSVLAAKVVKDQGIEVIGLCFKSYFFDEENAERMAKQIGIKLVVVDFSKEHFEMVKDPKHGWGKNMNPCIDCHAMMMRYSGEMLKKYDADFIVTGEVLNQRPMSQNRAALDIVKNESGFADKILRPLCAKNIKETQMEKDGLIDREKLFDISGRNRKVQMELAEKFKITDYPSPAGGCKLTEPNYSLRLRENLERTGDMTEKDIKLLRYGRHFVTDNKVKVIVTRTHDEFMEIKKIMNVHDFLFMACDYNGASVIIPEGNNINEDDIIFACRLAARYSKGKNEESIKIKFGHAQTDLENIREVSPFNEDDMKKYCVN